MLRREREREITKLACHAVQQQNELAAYRHAVAPFEEMLRKHTAYHATLEFRRIVAGVRALFVDDPGAPVAESSAAEGEFSAIDATFSTADVDFALPAVRAALYNKESSAEGADTTELAGTLPPTAGRLSAMFEAGRGLGHGGGLILCLARKDTRRRTNGRRVAKQRTRSAEKPRLRTSRAERVCCEVPVLSRALL